jgi:Immunity protein Imm1
MLAYWSDANRAYSRDINTAAEAISLIEELGSSSLEPSIVEFRDDLVGLAFGYAVGRAKTTLTFQYTLDPPYYASKADRPSEDAWFWSGQQHTECPGENMISHHDAKQAVQEFFKTKKLPTIIDWGKL